MEMAKKKAIYLDYAATTPVDPQVLEAMIPYLSEKFGNPSSLHREGQDARGGVEKAREVIAKAIGADSREMIFTAGGTEADNLAVIGAALGNRKKGNHLLTSAIEHSAVLAACRSLQSQGFEVDQIPVDGSGVVNPEDLVRRLRKETILVSVMHANNEIGTIQPIKEISGVLREREILFHVDAVQSFPHLPIDVRELGVDLASFSSHKLYGPKGAGALYARQGVKIVPLLHGGEQEGSLRAGTENVPALVGFGKAVEVLMKRREEDTLRTRELRDELLEGILSAIDHCGLNGDRMRRLPNNLNLFFDFVEGESLVIHLDLEGVSCSTGSACASGSVEPSHVMLAMGKTPIQARSSVRFTLGRGTTMEEVKAVLEILPRIIVRLRSASATGRLA